MAEEVAALKKKLEAFQKDESTASEAKDVLKVLRAKDVTKEVLKKTKIHATIKELKDHKEKEVASAASTLYNEWKKMFQGKDSSKPSTPKAPAKPSLDRVGSTASTASNASTASTASTLVAANVPFDKSDLKKTGDTLRDKFREHFFGIFANAWKEGQMSPLNLAEDLEGAMHAAKKGQEYKNKFRSLSFNLKDTKNPDLRFNVLEGNISAKRLVEMTPQEMASDEMKAKRDELEKIGAEKALPDRDGKQATTDQFQCGKCKKHKCQYYQMQTRSADEPMTTFVTCMNCGNRWKFC